MGKTRQWPKNANEARKNAIGRQQDIQGKTRQLIQEVKRNPDLAILIARDIEVDARWAEMELTNAQCDDE